MKLTPIETIATAIWKFRNERASAKLRSALYAGEIDTLASEITVALSATTPPPAEATAQAGLWDATNEIATIIQRHHHDKMTMQEVRDLAEEIALRTQPQAVPTIDLEAVKKLFYEEVYLGTYDLMAPGGHSESRVKAFAEKIEGLIRPAPTRDNSDEYYLAQIDDLISDDRFAKYTQLEKCNAILALFQSGEGEKS